MADLASKLAKTDEVAPAAPTQGVENTSATDKKDGQLLTQQEVVMYTVNPTVVDNNGIERILGPALDNWVAAPIEATDDQKKEAEQRKAKWDEASKLRQDQQVAGTGVNLQYDGGSQTPTS